MPVVALATTEMATVIENGKSGYVDTDVDALIEKMQELLRYPALAHQLGEQGRRRALARFGIRRFVDDWNAVLADVTGMAPPRPASRTACRRYPSC
jgi:glycosyltransferase involved in cell wall biosynthesis